MDEQQDFKDVIINQYKEQINEQNKLFKDVLEIMSADNKNKSEERKRNCKVNIIQLTIILFFSSLVTIAFIVSYFFGTYSTDYKSTSTSISESKSTSDSNK